MGYVIIHSPDGTHITASNQYWLDAAVERFIKSSRVSNGHFEAPFGLTTSFNPARRSRRSRMRQIHANGSEEIEFNPRCMNNAANKRIPVETMK
jgi:hypothetical protein